MVRVSGLLNSPEHYDRNLPSYYKPPSSSFKATFVERIKRGDYVNFDENSLERIIREKWERRGFNVLWIWELKRNMV